MEVQSMDSKAIIMVSLFLAFFLLSLSGRHGVEGGPRRILSDEEDLELEKQLKILNKPPVKTIQITSEDIFDCVDINKQPAFDHPLLKNHKIQMKPSFSLGRTKTETSPVAEISEIELGDEGCPKGTVPIRRTRKQDLINAKRESNIQSVQSIHPLTPQYPGQHFALAETPEGFILRGAKAFINLQNPSVNHDQYSMAQIWLENGAENAKNILRVGWAVHPQLYGGNHTHLTTHWTADGYQKTGCYNLLCPGFVQIDHSVPLGGIFTNISVYRGPQFITNLMVSQDPETSHWWLIWNDNKKIGYWPKEILPDLSQGANKLRYGGMTYGPPNGSSPAMGSGLWPSLHNTESCYFSNIKYLVNPNDPIDVDPDYISTETDNSKCYGIEFFEYQGSYLREIFSFGGPGGHCGV